MTPLEEPGMVEDRFLKRLRKKARKGLRGMADCDDCLLWPEPASSDKDRCRHRAIRECGGRRVTRAWIVDRGDVRGDSGIAREILEFIEEHQVRSIVSIR